MTASSPDFRGLYIDFECLKGSPSQRAHPALLGVLDGAGDHFEQFILDEQLAPGKVANAARLKVADIRAVVHELVARSKAERNPLVGWSFFDRERMIDAAPELAEEIRSLYVNALPVARRWRQAVYPQVRIIKTDRFAPRHTLDQYARLAGYADCHVFENATPAKWIGHVLRQLAATKGRYRSVTNQTKRDWHKLLEYNRHDCLALQLVMLKATRELECWCAYTRTRFCVADGDKRICFMAGSQSTKLDALVARHGASRWAFITAWNPGSIALTREENDRRQAELVRALQGYAMLSGEGVGEDSSWQPEQSVLVLDITRREAIRLGRQFGQLAVVAGNRGAPARLVSCAQSPE